MIDNPEAIQSAGVNFLFIFMAERKSMNPLQITAAFWGKRHIDLS